MALVPGEIVKQFRTQFHSRQTPALYRAPGRVNLIGEHTDYNLGFVCPIALEMACYAAIAPAASHNALRIFAHDFAEEISLPVADIPSARPRKNWSDYVIGVARELVKAGFPIEASDLYIASDVPLGSGLSSSAALEVATALALLNGRAYSKLDLAKLAQRAEIEFVGMPCGIMDQYASAFGHAGAALKIDCRSLGHEYVELPQDLKIVAVNSLVKHELGASAYRDRVAECAEAVAALREFDPKIESLRDVSLEFFNRVQDSIPVLPRRRARHIITDTERVVDLAAAAKKNELSEMGRLFVASHRSMQYDYEISCEEIDFLVDTAIKISGVYGARMTGGGFGGCTVNLVTPSALASFTNQLSAAYEERYQKTPIFYDCRPSAGAGIVEQASHRVAVP